MKRTKKKKSSSEKTKEYVFVYDNGQVKQVEVTTGIQDDEYIQILSGLKGDEEIVSAPYSAISRKLKDKMKVKKVDKKDLYEGDDKKSSDDSKD